MRASVNNPPDNQVPKGISEKALTDAIKGSGYPTQGLVASVLIKVGFSVTEEWAFPDRTTGEPRSLDVLGHLELGSQNDCQIRPAVLVLVECKKSAHPFVFFRANAVGNMPWFPAIAGLPHGGIVLTDKRKPPSAQVPTYIPGSRALGLNTLTFSSPGPELATVFTKAEPKGKKVRLSGSEPFNGLMLPLAGAFDHASQVYGHNYKHGAPTHVSPALLLCVAVLDGPMVLVEGPDRLSDPILKPWVRIVRQEPHVDPLWETRFKHYAVDAIHVSFFEAFLQDYVRPLARQFAARARNLGVGPMLNGGQVPDIATWKWSQIEERTT